MQIQNTSLDPSNTNTTIRLTRDSRTLPGLLIAAILLFFAVLIRRAWLSDDAFITFRTVDNFLNGYGLVWNLGERVQAYTHPLWMFTLSAAARLTGELVFTSMILSLLISLATLILLVTKIACSRLTALFLVVSLTLSNALVDYSTSGLENPLSHLLVVVFFIIFFIPQPSVKRIFWLSLIAALGGLNRLDLYLIFGPALLFALYQTRSIRAVLALLLGLIPLLAWELFSLYYYGFPFPNTAYAKLNTGIPANELFDQGIAYLYESMRSDPLTLVIIASGIALAFLGRERKNIPLALGILLYLLYLLKIGGDFMSGRFLAVPFLCALIILAHFEIGSLSRTLVVILFAAVFSISWLSPTPTLNFFESDLTPKERLDMVINNKIANERRYYNWSTALLRIDPEQGIPAHPFAEDGLETRQRSPRLSRRITVGMFGYYAGPDVFVVDELALADAFLARLPARRVDQWRIGHFQRTLPAGYLDTLRAGENLLQDSKLAALYDQLALITQADLSAPGRLKAIWRMNTGLAQELVDFDTYRYPKMITLDQADAAQVVPDGALWDAPGNQIFEESGIQLNLSELTRSPTLNLSLDSSNAYQLVFLKNGQEISSQVLPRLSKNPEMRSICLTTPDRALRSGFDALRIFSIQGDSKYSLGHFILEACKKQ